MEIVPRWHWFRCGMSEQREMRLEISDRAGSRLVAGHANRTGGTIAKLNGQELVANCGTSLNLDWVEQVRVNTSAVERRAATLVTRRTVKKDWQIAWLLRAITCMDLTTLSGDDTDERVKRLCAKARQPISQEIVEKLGIGELGIQVGAVCVYHLFVETARRALEGTKIPVAAVSTGFPAGLTPLEERIAEIRRSIEAGAQEIDVVITRARVFGGDWQPWAPEWGAALWPMDTWSWVTTDLPENWVIPSSYPTVGFTKERVNMVPWKVMLLRPV